MPNTIPPSFPPTGTYTQTYIANTTAHLQDPPAYLVVAQKKIAQEMDSIEGHAAAARILKSAFLQLEQDLKSGTIGTQEFDARFNQLAKDSLRVNLNAKIDFLKFTTGKYDPRIPQLQALDADLMSGKLSLEECKARYSEIVKTIDPSPPSKPSVAIANILNNLD